VHKITTENKTVSKYDNELMEQLCTRLLKDGWQHGLQKEILSSKQGSLRFNDWQNKMGAMNSLLVGTTFHIPTTALRNHLAANMHHDLASECDDNNAHEIVTFQEWVDTVMVLDQRRFREAEKQRRLLEEALKTERARNAKVLTGPSAHGNRTTTTNNTSVTTSTPSIPKLTAADRTLLNEHEGCYKCRNFYVSHRGAKCPNGFPEASTYKPLTVADALAAKKKRKPVVAAVVAAPEVVAAMGMTSCVIGDGTDSESYVQHVPHIYWDCLVDSPPLESPVAVQALIDCACTTVMIKPEFADSLGLTRVPLHKPMEVTLAMDSGEAERTFKLVESVSIKLYSVDSSWASKTVCAVVAPGLCTSIILGQSFLATNSIVIDFKERTVINKRSGYDLLNPPPPAAPPKCTPSRRNLPKRGTIIQQRSALMKELKSSALPFLQSICDRVSPSLTPPEKFLAAVRIRVEQLASVAAMKTLDAEFKERFADRFAELPHVDDLPTDVYHRVQLKDPYQTVACKGYGCPCKYREAWSILIQQHLDAGRIRPSTSPYASPAFIVPKADPTVLPRWVNDYQKINANTVSDKYPLPRVDDILADCAKGKIWGKIDMTNSFFQT
jgi:hypothetical protein